MHPADTTQLIFIRSISFGEVSYPKPSEVGVQGGQRRGLQPHGAFLLVYTSDVWENAATLLCCEAPEIFCGLRNFHRLSRRQRLDLIFCLNLYFKSPLKFCCGICRLLINVCGSSATKVGV